MEPMAMTDVVNITENPLNVTLPIYYLRYQYVTNYLLEIWKAQMSHHCSFPRLEHRFIVIGTHIYLN